MGGQIGVESFVGKGSQFWFEISLDPAAPEIIPTSGHSYVLAPELSRYVPEESIPEAVVEEGSGPRVLIVEDNPVNQMVAKKLLQRLGAQITTAMDGAEAVTLVKELEFDIVLMDVQMPVMGGLEATNLIREWEIETRRSRLPIVALTANAMEDDRTESLSAGMDDFLSKPVRKPELEALLAKWVPAPWAKAA
jgi:CheY-like chemotaxis protein